MTTQPNLHRLRYTVRGVLVLGMAASVAANVLHADPNLISKVIAAWPPIALLLAIELVIHVPVHRLAITRLRRAGTLLIAGIAAYVSYWHMAGVAERYGESGLSVFLLPLSVDGLIAVASICLVEISGRLRTENAPEPVIHVIDPAGQGVGRWAPTKSHRRRTAKAVRAAAEAIEPAPNEEARNGHDRPRTVAARKPSYAAAVRDAKAIHGDNRAAVIAAVRDIYPEVSADTLRKTLARMNGHAHV